ncbi:hypothetical protein SNE510_44180 [Streptomyces sp. NE5-10]|uniref:hypothetical protein n=1 Tax=Streptomyces sp. NE5-10 TaxID=2759674 RepID=UPI0019087381|nr:hypothetical protein [Streptomyces sp. NE5-10]GHJ94899.1 hypothetical protein SNE510_44180 [Streptomyces sp. NE5-10]
MSFEDPARAPRGRRRHASARRGRGVVWLAAAGGIAVLGLGAAALTGGGARGPAERDADGGGLPTLIQADPTANGTTPEPDSPPSRTATAGPAVTGRPTATASSATPSPSGSAPAAPSASSTPSAEPVPDASDATRSAKPGRGRGNGKGRG